MSAMQTSEVRMTVVPLNYIHGMYGNRILQIMQLFLRLSFADVQNLYLAFSLMVIMNH